MRSILILPANRGPSDPVQAWIPLLQPLGPHQPVIEIPGDQQPMSHPFNAYSVGSPLRPFQKRESYTYRSLSQPHHGPAHISLQLTSPLTHRGCSHRWKVRSFGVVGTWGEQAPATTHEPRPRPRPRLTSSHFVWLPNNNKNTHSTGDGAEVSILPHA